MTADTKGNVVGPGAASFGPFFNLSPDLLCVIGLDGCFKDLNPAWEGTLGFSREELKENSFVEFIHPEDRESTRMSLQGIIAGTDTDAFTNRFLCRDGSIRWLSWTTALALNSEGIYAIAHDITARMQREESLRRALAQRRELLARLLSVREEERTQLARVVHDEMGQVLTGLKMDLSWLSERFEPEQSTLLAKTQAMSDLIDTTIQAIRRISIELRPPILDDLGLVAAIDWLLQDLQRRTGLHCELVTSEEEVPLDIDGRTTVFRILQEILTNVSRHADASQVKVFVQETGQHLILRVHDNGRGISQDEIHDAKSIGLLGMRERALLRGGDVHIEGIPGAGTTVTVRLPLENGPLEGSDADSDWPVMS